MNAPDKKNQITLRLPKDTDIKIAEESKKIGISKNAFILLALSKALGKPLAGTG